MNEEVTRAAEQSGENTAPQGVEQLARAALMSAEQTRQMAEAILDLNERTEHMVEQVNDIADRMDQLEYRDEITCEQRTTITTAAHRRVYELLGRSEYDRQRYYSSFVSRCYSEQRPNGLLRPIGSTRRENYQRILESIGTWVPAGGPRALKAEIDEKAAARRRAREFGYAV